MFAVHANAVHGLQVINASGVIVYAASDAAWRMPFGVVLDGVFQLVAMNSIADLCKIPLNHAPSLTGHVVLGGSFFGAGCSYESRARGAQARNASGIIFSGFMHTPFDWDGTDRSDLASLGTAVIDEANGVYDSVQAAVAATRPIKSSIVLHATRTPLLDTSFATFQWALCALILAMCVGNVCTGLVMMVRLLRLRRHDSAKLVVALEVLSQCFFLIRSVAGPGYDLTHPLVLPNFVYRLFLSLWIDCHMLAMVLVFSQLHRTIEQARPRSSAPMSQR